MGDLSSCLYGKPPHPQSATPDTWRDVWERYIARLSWLLCIPTLGICRGMQLMNVALGGTLYQDLRAQWPKERPTLLRHRARGRVSSSNWVSHPIQLAWCAFCAGLGASILQMLLLAQAWLASRQALVPACMASAWVIGSLLGMRQRATPRSALWSDQYRAPLDQRIARSGWRGEYQKKGAYTTWH